MTETQTIEQLGTTGEKNICKLLRMLGYPVRKSDGHIFIDGQYCMIEHKTKSREWFAPPFDGQGLDLEQWEHYIDFYKRTGIRVILFIECHGETIWNYIDELNKVEKPHITPSKLIVFPLDKFRPWRDLIFD